MRRSPSVKGRRSVWYWLRCHPPAGSSSELPMKHPWQERVRTVESVYELSFAPGFGPVLQVALRAWKSVQLLQLLTPAFPGSRKPRPPSHRSWPRRSLGPRCIVEAARWRSPSLWQMSSASPTSFSSSSKEASGVVYLYSLLCSNWWPRLMPRVSLQRPSLAAETSCVCPPSCAAENRLRVSHPCGCWSRAPRLWARTESSSAIVIQVVAAKTSADGRADEALPAFTCKEDRFSV